MTFEVVYFEMTRLTRKVEADTLEEAIAKSEALRTEGEWDDCQEDTLGTNGVERVELNGETVYDAGTKWGLVDEGDDE